MGVLAVYSTNGQGRREIVVPGRSPQRPFGAIQIINNVGQRQESDWAGIKACIAAGDVVICLSGYETDVLPQRLEGTFPHGGNVRFETRKTPNWQLFVDEGGAFCHFQVVGHTCKECGELFETAYKLGGHVTKDHRPAAHRTLEGVA